MIYNGEKVSKNITALSAVQWVAACDGAFTDGVALDAPSLARELTRWAKWHDSIQQLTVSAVLSRGGRDFNARALQAENVPAVTIVGHKMQQNGQDNGHKTPQNR
jgi:hypothetical protein